MSAAVAGAAGGVGAIVVAAGSSTRMGGIDKVFAPLAGRPLVSHSIEALERCPSVDRIVVVLSADNLHRGRELVHTEAWARVTVVAGGKRRQDSVRAGLDALPPAEWTIVHDGARPCVTGRTFEQGLAEARRTGAAIAGVPVKDTVKIVDADLNVTATPDRSAVWAVHTPQVFSTELLKRAHDTISDDVTDDASMVERLGAGVRVFFGSYANIKVTTAEDLAIAEALIASGSVSESEQEVTAE